MTENDYSFAADKDLFIKQFSTFDVKSFPDYDEVKNRINNLKPVDQSNCMTESEFTQEAINFYTDLDYYYFYLYLENLKKNQYGD